MILTSRLLIRKWSPEMAQDFFELSQDEGFRLFPITNYQQSDIESAKVWIQNNVGKMSVHHRDTSNLLGMGGLTPWQFQGEELIDITYRLRKSAWGQGLGFELAKGLIDHGFNELKLKQITATITPDNIPSQKIAAKLGMKFDQHIILLGVPTDLYRLRL